MQKIVFIAWKDIQNPDMGGAEIVHQQISERLVQDGHEVIHLVPGFKNCSKEDLVNGVKIIRVGQSVLSFIFLQRYFKKNLSGQTDILIDCFNAFGSLGYMSFSGKSYFMIHHIQDVIWKYQTTPPFVFPFNWIGYAVEKLQLRFIAKNFSGELLTVSDSTAHELREYGFDQKLHILHEGTDIEHVEELNDKNNSEFNVLFVGRMVNMKQPEQALETFIKFNKQFPESKMNMVGNGPLLSKLKLMAQESGANDKIIFHGRVGNQEKLELMRKSDVIIVTSVKEGWGLIVTEANAQGTPAITYDVPGLRDSNSQGLLSEQNTPESLALRLGELYQNPDLYNKIRLYSWKNSFEYTFDQCYLDFKRAVGLTSV